MSRIEMAVLESPTASERDEAVKTFEGTFPERMSEDAFAALCTKEFGIPCEPASKVSRLPVSAQDAEAKASASAQVTAETLLEEATELLKTQPVNLRGAILARLSAVATLVGSL